MGGNYEIVHFLFLFFSAKCSRGQWQTLMWNWNLHLWCGSYVCIAVPVHSRLSVGKRQWHRFHRQTVIKWHYFLFTSGQNIFSIAGWTLDIKQNALCMQLNSFAENGLNFVVSPIVGEHWLWSAWIHPATMDSNGDKSIEMPIGSPQTLPAA